MSLDDRADLGSRIATADFTRSVHALFDRRDEADKARQDLIAAGIPDASITLESQPALEDPAGLVAQPDQGFWDRVIGLFIPDDDKQSYTEGLRRGGIAVVVRTDTANYDRVIDLLDRDGAVDLDERQESWRREGWGGYTGRDPLADARSPSLSFASAEEEPSTLRPSDATAGFAASQADHFPVPDADAPLVESPGAIPADMRGSTPDTAYQAAAPGLADPDTGGAAWRRDTSHGRTRVRTYAADTARPGDDGPDRSR